MSQDPVAVLRAAEPLLADLGRKLAADDMDSVRLDALLARIREVTGEKGLVARVGTDVAGEMPGHRTLWTRTVVTEELVTDLEEGALADVVGTMLAEQLKATVSEDAEIVKVPPGA